MNFLGLGVLNAAMLAGLAGVAIPLVIHLLNRRNDPVVDWGAMQFLEFSPRERRRLNLAEILLMLARMLPLALAALALARPFWTPGPAGASAAGTAAAKAASGVRRDVVLILDGSDSMGRRAGGSTPRDRAVAWARGFVARLGPGDSVAVLVAKDRVRPLVDPPSFDLGRVDKALAEAPGARGSSDLAAALGEAFRILEKTGNPGRDVVILTDGRRQAWRPGDVGRWALLRDLRRRLPTPPRIWAPRLDPDAGAAGETPMPDASVGPLALSRSVLTPGLAVDVTASVANAGPGPSTRIVELAVDGVAVPGSGRPIGPIPAGGRVPVSFRTAFDGAGSHLVAVRLVPDADPLPVDDESARPVAVAPALAVLLVDGEPGVEPLSGEVDFLRAALAPGGDPSPLVVASTVPASGFRADSLRGQRVAVLANLDRPSPEVASALGPFLDGGGGLLIAPGDRLDAGAWDHPAALAWLPARIGPLRGDFAARAAVARPAPATFDGPALGPLGKGDAPPLGRAGLFAYRVLEPRPGAAVVARLDSGDPWVVERARGRGRVALLAGPLDAEGGTLPVNPDFVPWTHELIAHLAEGAEGPRAIRPGEPLAFDLDPPPPPGVTALRLTTPAGTTASLPVVRDGGKARVRTGDTAEPGIYRLDLADPPGGHAYAAVAADPGAADPAPLDPAEAEALARDWPLSFDPDPAHLADDLLAVAGGGRAEAWRGLVLLALAGLCLEVWLTRRMASRVA